MAQTFDTAVKERLRAVVDGRPVTEAELRKLFEEGQACALIVSGQLERGERKLSELASDSASSIAELAITMRSLNELRPDLEELNELVDALNARAREFRATWVSRPTQHPASAPAHTSGSARL